MDSSFTPIEQMLKFRASRHEDFPYQEILLTRLCMHMQSKLLENRNKMLKAQGINETLFMALITLESQENHSIQPSELSCALASSVPTRRVLPMNWKNAVGLNVVKAITIAAACICN